MQLFGLWDGFVFSLFVCGDTQTYFSAAAPLDYVINYAMHQGHRLTPFIYFSNSAPPSGFQAEAAE